jgi:hypothetical protein
MSDRGWIFENKYSYWNEINNFDSFLNSKIRKFTENEYK